MTPRLIKFGLVAVALLSVSVGANLLALQPLSERSDRPSRAYRGIEHLPGASSTAPAGKMPDAAQGAGGVAVPRARAARPEPSSLDALAASIAAETDVGGTGPSAVDLVRQIQVGLSARGYMPGEADGIEGIVTRAAIMAYEHDQGMPLTASASTAVLASLQRNQPAGPRQPASSVPSTEAQNIIRTVQLSLDRLGYRPGPSDGRLGDATSTAVRAFESDNNLPLSGRVSGLLLVHLAQGTAKGRIAAR
ncbi:MAG: peptidoglycan-binding protein [Hyphomicrobiaceae bacterium]|nr:peptidoglycan-binding protein [Hyphomicrobiaceae bacterium]